MENIDNQNGIYQVIKNEGNIIVFEGTYEECQKYVSKQHNKEDLITAFKVLLVLITTFIVLYYAINEY